ncbi:MAG: glycosyltransferase family 2 protein, partial [Candidatus Tenebribacter burtonii]|nr:glycosyltransferase family 2 protein [Candidatus Tenebribacter burtonii]
YNEIDTIEEIIYKVQAVKIEKEIVVVDDGSTDGTKEFLIKLQENKGEVEFEKINKFVNVDNIRIFFQSENRGKGAAINRGFRKVKGDVVVIQDADLEYDPREYLKLIKPIEEDFADVVYGSRFMGGNPHSILFFWHSIGNKFLTFLSNIFTNLNLTDMETCYKMFKSEIVKEIEVKEKRFGIEPEITAKISKMNVRIVEVGISYYGRRFDEGKKISWKDAIEAILCILKYNLRK